MEVYYRVRRQTILEQHVLSLKLSGGLFTELLTAKDSGYLIHYCCILLLLLLLLLLSSSSSSTSSLKFQVVWDTTSHSGRLKSSSTRCENLKSGKFMFASFLYFSRFVILYLILISMVSILQFSVFILLMFCALGMVYSI
jgi:hypothetical protein